MEAIESRKLKGTYRCKTYHDHADLISALNSGKKAEGNYEKAVAIYSAIDNILIHKISEKDALKEVEEAFDKIPYPTEETRRRLLEEAENEILRYTRSEKRKPKKAKEKIVTPFGLFPVSVKPTYIFWGYKEYKRKTINARGRTEYYQSIEPYVEIVKLKTTKPDVSMRGKKKDAGVMTSLELYCMLMYAKEVAKTCPYAKPGFGINIEASYYFLRRNSEKKPITADFFDGGGNVVTLSDFWYPDFPDMESDIDRAFKGQFIDFMTPTECDPDSCKRCELQAHCKFTKPPVCIEKELSQKSLSDLSLTDAQEAVIGFRKGFGRVNAGAGSGKTMCVALRTAMLLSEGVDPSSIILITFTNTGAEEMRVRIALYCEDLGVEADLSKLTITTFNAFGDQIVRENFEELNFEKAPRLIDEIERASIIASLLRKHVIKDLDYRNFNMNMPYVKGALPTTKRAFYIIKSDRLFTESDAPALVSALSNENYHISEDTAKELIDLYGEYDEILFNRCLIEFQDQELLIFDLLNKNPFYFEDYGVQHLIIDEFQDTSELQFEIVKNIINSSLDFQSLLVVGDDSQSIFGFRGSDPQFIVEFESKLGEKVTDFFLLENHRSTKRIIDFANKINALNVHRVIKDLEATREEGEPVHVEAFWNKNDEEDYVVAEIKKRIESGAKLEDIAYIGATRDQLLKIGTRLTEENLPWILLNPEPMFSNSRVNAAFSLAKFFDDTSATKDAFTYLNCASKSELLEKEDDDNILDRVQKLKAVADLIRTAEEPVKISTLMDMLHALNDEDEIYESFLEKVQLRTSYDEIIKYILDFSSYGEAETAKRSKDYPGIVLTTAHSSKGMEFPIVFNEISKYHTKTLRADEIEEKRRLLFVSSTRARDVLYVIGQVVSYGSKGNGKSVADTRVKNRFLEESLEVQGKIFPPEQAKKKKEK